MFILTLLFKIFYLLLTNLNKYTKCNKCIWTYITIVKIFNFRRYDRMFNFLRKKNVDTIIAFKGSLPSEWSWVISKKGRTLTHIDEHDKPLVLHVNTVCSDNWIGSFSCFPIYCYWINIECSSIKNNLIFFKTH